MKSDFDAFLTPGFLSFKPDHVFFGIQEYGILPATQDRLKRVAKDLGFSHKGRHNLGPTWVGEPATIIAMANYTIPVMHHIITKEFEQLPGGGIAQKWYQGEGFPLWSAGMAAMYATEIVANHFVDRFESTYLMDMHGDSNLTTDEVLHIHCRHGDGDFNKYDFFKHHYEHVSVKDLDLRIVKDYATYLAVSSWRALNPRIQDSKSEL
ncbi:hypothetical protein CEUSTIGMA_g7487.t1 [Chlamydomonas eustigma]|uniref:DUF7164 domain-containing protein n=1 Tax=Chlamydomonas eustigma TaxID=1157962 RepID=A0A250XAE1_9CHLO|nr:hypothetical protein CEUSTIGMA_g7487.t1 [Chlamydomonas eustigma]|eukprot:GAX80048.1 hypothetical protein CEUSTIGMA_g7487.t1 [Chlamydomonas eustigma]